MVSVSVSAIKIFVIGQSSVYLDGFKVKFLRNKSEMLEKVLQKPREKSNSNLFRPANFTNRSSFGQVMILVEKGKCRIKLFRKFSTKVSIK